MESGSERTPHKTTHGDPTISEMGKRDEVAKVHRFKQWLDNSSRTFAIWRERAIESYRFVGNEQWGTDDLEVMRSQNRPALTINKIFPQVMWLTGVQRQQRQEPKMLPMEPGDSRMAELMGYLYKWVGSRCREPVVDSRVFQDKVVTGMGFWKCGVDFDDDLQGKLIWERLHPLSVFPDPNFLDDGWEKAEYVQHAQWMTIDQAQSMWPEQKDRIRRQYGEWINDITVQGGSHHSGGGSIAGDSLSDHRTFWDPETQRVRVVECWYKVRVPVTVAVNVEDGNVLAEPEVVKQLQANPDASTSWRFIKRQIPKTYVAHYLNDILLADDLSPFQAKGFPIFPTIGYYFWRRPFGTVEVLKDLQREHNVRRSTIIEMVRRAALSGFLNHSTKGAKSEELENYSAGVGKIINHAGVPPQEIRPPELPQTLVFLDQKADTDMNTVTNIHSEMLGDKSQRFISGRAIQARQSSGMAVQEPMLESFKQDKEMAARFMVQLIQQFVTVPRAARVLGSVAVRNPGGPEAQLLGPPEDPTADIQELLSGAFSEEFDVVLGSKPWEPSQKQQLLSALLELVETFGPDQMPPEMLVEALRDAGVLTEDQANKVIMFQQQKQAMQQAAVASGIQSGTPVPGDALQ